MFTILGIDIGSVAISLVLIDENKKILYKKYTAHHGAIIMTLGKLLDTMELQALGGIAVTTSSPDIVKNAVHFDNQVSIISAARYFHSRIGSILFVGGQNFGLIRFNKKGEYESYRTNSSCAAGTGSFLDQQAERLNLENTEILSSIAFTNTGNAPAVATRCAVFAKTDIIHAQQEGYSVGQISDGLCEGLAKNIIDTLIPDENAVGLPLIFAGGVSMNLAVVKHLQNLLHITLQVDDYSYLYGAIGAALLFLEEQKPAPIPVDGIASIIQEIKKEKEYEYIPLSIRKSYYPVFESTETFIYTPHCGHKEVEVDIYREPESRQQVYMGIDIGSISTKAILIDTTKQVIAGFYTRTSGQPIKAVQAIFEAIDHMSTNRKVSLQFSGVGTTGSGRKFIGKVINADLMIDEITAHARAAYELNNKVDTIIEIGGQDSKFTTMKNGMVTFSVMNNVCAAGTGSFIEEQAHKLECPLSEYSDRAMNVPAPYASDRCTVFMERDLNYYLIAGYSVEEVLASVLHSVRDNYLTKVAIQGAIGNEICFQGATAKNKALVAAFEQKLQKPIFVSRYCHLTGALGSALMLQENDFKNSAFRGLSLYREDIPLETEVCDLCRNNCKINKVTVRGDIVAFGFLCGRDYDTKKYKANNKDGFNLIHEYRKAFTLPPISHIQKTDKTIGIPDGLYLTEEGVLWKYFFSTLGVKTISSKGMEDPIKTGKKMTTTEFCAPTAAFLGHVEYCARHADYIFLPVYLETREKENSKKYCYFTQYASIIASSIEKLNLQDRMIMPEINSNDLALTMELVKILRPLLKCSYWSVYFAYQQALAFYREGKEKLKNIFKREFEQVRDISILFMGRPYIVLNNTMNKLIPDIFRNLNIKTFFQDMLHYTYTKEESKEIRELIKAFHWNYASTILEAAQFAAKTDKLYPVYITSFKCGPDSFALEYFKRIMDAHQKPYLILQLDEHDSNVGYETRIEAAIRSFQNHSSTLKTGPAQHPPLTIPWITKKISEKTLLLPSWDHLNIKLIEAVLIRSGIDARMVPLTSQAIQRGPATNTGMCIPVNIIIQSIIDYIEEQYMDPEQTAVWVFESNLACNIKLYPYFIKSALEAYGKNMEKVSVYLGDFTFKEISYKTPIDAYFAHYFGGMLRRMGCRIRPYEKKQGITDKTIEQSLSIFYNTILGNRNKEKAVKKVVHLFKKIKTNPALKPKVAILGDIYVRDNDIMNQHLIHFIEKQGGEAIIMPCSDIIKMMVNPHIERSLKSGIITDAITAKALITLIQTLEKNYHKYFREILREAPIQWNDDIKKILDFFHLKIEHNGESVDNILISYALKMHYPDIRLFIHTVPAFCSAGLVTEALEHKIEKLTGVPVVTLIYDGTHKNQNEKLIPYMKFYK